MGEVAVVLYWASWSGAILGRLEWCYIGQVGEGRAGKGEGGTILGRAAAVGRNIVQGAGAIIMSSRSCSTLGKGEEVRAV